MNSLERKKAELTALLEVSKVLSSSFNLEENLSQAGIRKGCIHQSGGPPEAFAI